MGNILLVTENHDLNLRCKDLFSGGDYNFYVCENSAVITDLAEVTPLDLIIIDTKVSLSNLPLILKRIKSKFENIQILLLSDSNNLNTELSRLANGFLLDTFSDEMIKTFVNTFLKNKEKSDVLFDKNKELADSLYKLNVLYSTSSQFAGTLDVKKLIDYLLEGLDKSLSYDLTCTISFGIEDVPVLIVNSLYDLSDELLEALTMRAVLNYKSLFRENNIPFELDEKTLKIVKYIKNPTRKFNFTIFQYDNMFAPIDLGDNFFGCIEIFRETRFTTDDASYFQTMVRQVSLPLKSAGLYSEIINKNEKLEKLERVKSDFISIVSHELRTPLTPVKNALSILSSGRCGELSDNAVKFVNMAKRNVDNLTNIINDILDINKIEAGKMDFNYKLMNIHSVIDNVKTNFDCVAKEHNITLSTSEQPELPDVYADSQRLGQVLTNLVSNAIKYTPDGKNITIKSELKESGEITRNPYFENYLKNLDGTYVIVSVIDEGVGIKKENMQKAFDKFTQIESPLSRKAGGTGLGLPIAKQLIEAHNGKIWCDSEENKGTSFHFAIPVSEKVPDGKTIQKALL